ncbi:hypothetical protein GCM10009535_05630 [Streptomyces thermocarboxydovorans]|uniref:Uncharacterized protein n=1 Tax=Streptomyces thermocarboxydovorans TaxID=59298 RepID=A0ABP3SCK8_9ACTN
MLPAISVATRSPAPTPVAATTIPGPMYLQLLLRGPEPASAPAPVSWVFPVCPVVSAMGVKKSHAGRRDKRACGDLHRMCLTV